MQCDATHAMHTPMSRWYAYLVLSAGVAAAVDDDDDDYGATMIVNRTTRCNVVKYEMQFRDYYKVVADLDALSIAVRQSHAHGKSYKTTDKVFVVMCLLRLRLDNGLTPQQLRLEAGPHEKCNKKVVTKQKENILCKAVSSSATRSGRVTIKKKLSAEYFAFFRLRHHRRGEWMSE